MLLLARRICGTGVEAVDGSLGRVMDLVFDDRNWHITLLVLDAGTWLNKRRVTMPPDLLGDKDWANHRLMVRGLKRQQVIDAPGVETHIPVGDPSRHEEVTMMDWTVYWSNAVEAPPYIAGDPHLRSVQELTGYHIMAKDGPIGHIRDVVVDEEAWTVRSLALDTRNWWPGKHVLAAPAQIDRIDWKSYEVWLKLSRSEIEHSPEYRPTSKLGEVHELLGSGPSTV